MSEYIWSEHAKQRAEERFSGVNLDIELLAAKRLGKKARRTVRRLCPVSAAKWMSSGFVGRYCLKAKSGIVFVMQAPNTVVTVFKIGEVVELSENELRQNLEINSFEQRLTASEAELKQALQILARLQAENTELKEQLEIEKYRIDILQEENMDLRDEKQNLDDQIADLVHERENG